MRIPYDETSSSKAPRNYMIGIKIINDFKRFSQKRRWTGVVKTLHRQGRSHNRRSLSVDIRRTGSRKLFLNWKQRIHLCKNRVEIKFPPKKFHSPSNHLTQSINQSKRRRTEEKKEKKRRGGRGIGKFHWESIKIGTQLHKYQNGRR